MVCVCVCVCACVCLSSPLCLYCKLCQLVAISRLPVQTSCWSENVNSHKTWFLFFTWLLNNLSDIVFWLSPQLENVSPDFSFYWQVKRRFSDCQRWSHCVKTVCRHAVMEANLWSDLCCVFQLGDPGGLHHHTPSACCQGETVYREHWGAGTGGQRTGQGNGICFTPATTENTDLDFSHENTVIRTRVSHTGRPNLYLTSFLFSTSKPQLPCSTTPLSPSVNNPHTKWKTTRIQ